MDIAAVAFDEFDLAVLPAELFHLLDAVMNLQISLCTLLQFAVNFLIVSIPVRQQTLG